MKDMFSNFSDSQKKMLKMLGILLLVIVAIILVVVIFKSMSGGKVSHEQFENVMVRAAERYVKADPEVIESEVYGTTEISAATLAKKGYMKEITEYFGKDTKCEGKVLVYKNLDYYKYIPKLNCGEDYNNQSISEVIIDEKNIVTTGSGIYKQGDNYVFRGEYVDNYVSYAEKTWRIISIDANGNIKMIQTDDAGYSVWDNRYNSDYGYTSGINSFEGIEASRIKNTILNAYNNEKIFTAEAKSLIVPNQYCVGKRAKTDASKDGNTECAVKSELMGATGLTVSEYLNASLDENCNSMSSKSCANYNYLAKFGNAFWTVTAQSENTGYAYAISRTVQVSQASASYVVKLVVTVNGNINYTSGTGTLADPYIIK